MTAPPTLDGTAVEEASTDEPGQALVPAVQTLAVTPTVKASELVERLDVIREAMNTAMTANVDYGVIPGTNKPTLLKPGSEKLGVLFQLDVQLHNEKVWGPGDHLTVLSHATVYHAPSGTRLGYGEGICSTREKKYAVRTQQRVCPKCKAPSVFQSKREPGFYCWAKKGGCGAQFAVDDPAITGQETGEIENPDLPDLWNTVVKMAEKRARVDATLAVTGASALFTQDAEDIEQPADHGAPATQSQPPPRTTAQEPEATVETATEAQMRAYFGIVKNLGAVEETQAKAVLHLLSGERHADRVPKGEMSAVIDLLKRIDEAKLAPDVLLGACARTSDDWKDGKLTDTTPAGRRQAVAEFLAVTS